MSNSESTKKESYYQKNKEKILIQQQAKRNAKYEGLIDGYDYITCKECGFRSSELATHIIIKHSMTVDEYKEKHKVKSIKSQKSIDRVKGEKNPAYQHGGKYSPVSKNFIYAETNNIQAVVEKTKNTKKVNNTDTTQIEYWLKKTNGNLEEAQKLLSQRQTTFSLDICIEKHGKEKGKEIWLDRQEHWHKSHKKSNFSKVSQDLFWNIVKNLNDLSDIYFAQLDENKVLDESGNNNELRIRVDKVILPDFIDMKQKKIIEFDGTYWHDVKNKQYEFSKNPDTIKENILLNNGYKILRIKEIHYKNNKEETIKKCLDFLTR
jgi:hypothetical protein